MEVNENRDRRYRYSKEFKQKVLDAVENRGRKSIRSICVENGISRHTLALWRKNTAEDPDHIKLGKQRHLRKLIYELIEENPSLSISSVCAAHGVSMSSFYYWRKVERPDLVVNIKRQEYSEKFRKQVVDELESRDEGVSLAEVAATYGLNPDTVADWRDRFRLKQGKNLRPTNTDADRAYNSPYSLAFIKKAISIALEKNIKAAAEELNISGSVVGHWLRRYTDYTQVMADARKRVKVDVRFIDPNDVDEERA